MSSTTDPSALLAAYEASGDTARRRELALLLADAFAGTIEARAGLLPQLRALRGRERDPVALAQLRRVIVQAEARAVGLRYDAGLAALEPAERERIQRSLQELDSLHRSLSPEGPGFAEAYEFVSLGAVASGGFGDVYRMRRRADGLEVAVKFLKAEVASWPTVAERFARESRTLRAVAELGGHPNLLPWIEDGTEGQRAFLVTRWAAGGSLRDALLAQPGGLDLDFGLRWLRELLAGLRALHDWGLIHRDVKPGNVYLAGEGEGGGSAWLGDFGVVLPLDEARMTQVGHSSPGTRGYAPPEQLLGGEQDERTDLHSWAVTAFELLVGRRPEEPGESPRALRAELPAAWDEAIRACHRPRRLDRPRDVAALLEILGDD